MKQPDDVSSAMMAEAEKNCRAACEPGAHPENLMGVIERLLEEAFASGRTAQERFNPITCRSCETTFGLAADTVKERQEAYRYQRDKSRQDLYACPTCGLTGKLSQGSLIRMVEGQEHTKADPDPWSGRETAMTCDTCRHYRLKTPIEGRCRKRSPTMDGYPVVFARELGCGDHRLNENR